MKNQQWSMIDQFLDKADSILITSHIDPDGDALGSMLAMAYICEQWGKRVVCVNESSIPRRFSFLPGIDKIVRPHQVMETFHYVIAVDAADRSRVGENVERLFHSEALILNIDHHITNDRFGSVNLIDPHASSTAEIIYQWLAHSPNVRWDSRLSTFLYTGILTDTGGFRYANTSANVLRYAAELIEYGAPAHEIADQALETVTFKQTLCMQRALTTIETSANGQIAWLSLSQADLQQIQATDADIEGIVNIPRKIIGVDVGIFFRETSEHTVKVSFRSRQKVDVSKIAQAFGGGGHPRAAGCTIEGTLEDVKRQVLQRVEAELGCA